MSVDHGPAVSGTTLRAFLYADPAAHSLSPRMHNAAFKWAGLAGEYEARRVAAADLPAAVQDLRQPGTLGANLSLPHKESALTLLDTLSDAARAIGAVNTIAHQDGQLVGDNTDAPGLMAALEDAGADQRGPVVVLGAGGAARAAVWALGAAGREVLVVNRTLARAEALARDLGGQACEVQEVPWTAVTLMINASSAGLGDAASTPLPEFDFGRLAQGALVYDMVYKPTETRLMREARQASLRAENGLGMLAHQARLAFQVWTGRDVPVGVFLDALAGAVS